MKKRLLGLMLLVLSSIALSSCGGGSSANDETPLVFSIQEVDKVFNPFYSTSASDSEVVGYTQIGMLGNDKDGKVTYGNDEPVVVLDYEEVTKGTEDVDQTTTYYFVLKNDVKFSNGSPLTIKDVLFNLYVYLDPVYTGSSTIYSTDIVGLQEYRTQEADEKEQDSFMEQFEMIASDRITALADAASEILDDDPYIELEEFKNELQAYTSIDYYKNVVVDFEKACELFEEELNTDYTNSMGTAEDISFKDSNDNVHKPFTTDIEAFLYNEGYLTWDKENATVISSLTSTFEEVKYLTKDNVIQTILEAKLPGDIVEIVYYWNTSVLLNEFLVNQALTEYYATGDRTYKNISGIQFVNRTKSVTVNGKNYTAPTYAEDGSVNNDTNEVLAITINGVDPKAIWNFAFSVAPMYYYSDKEHIEAFDYEENFGVEYSSQDFQNNVIKNPSKIGLPVGAGAYQVSKNSGGTENVSAGDFCDKGVIYYERNEYYLMGAPKIKMLRLQVVASSSILNALYNGEVDFVSPNAKPETISELDAKKSSGIANETIKTSGYGYIGINAGKVPDMEVRQAIMHAINTAECVSYYGTLATAVHRSMSTASWAYPTGATSYYPYIGGEVPQDLSVVNPYYADYVEALGKKAGDTLTEEEQIAFIRGLVESAGYVENSNGVYYTSSNTLKYTFTIAGQETDHPAWTAMYHAAEILNKCGFEVTVSTDANALSKLTTGGLSVWAAAWSSTIDPDMYQIYHMDSKATSVNNWGYKQILQNTGGKYDEELALVEELSELIDAGRKTTDQSARKIIYSKALDIVMQLAVELPTYQRVDLYAYNINKIDESTLTPKSELSPYNGLTSEIWKLSLNK